MSDEDELSSRRGRIIFVDDDGPEPPLTADDAKAWRGSAVNLAADMADLSARLATAEQERDRLRALLREAHQIMSANGLTAMSDEINASLGGTR